MTDAQIIRLFWDRDEDAIGACERRYGQYCRRIAMNVLHDSSDAEECVNDSWHRAWRSIPPETPSSLGAYLGRITRNLALSRYRADHTQKRFHGVAVLLSELEDCIPSTEIWDRDLEHEHLVGVVDAWLRSLPQEERVLFVRRYWYGDALEALARSWGWSESRISKRLSSLRKQLKIRLDQEGI